MDTRPYHNMSYKTMMLQPIHHGFVVLSVLWVLIIAPWCCIIHCTSIAHVIHTPHQFVCDGVVADAPAPTQAIRALPLPVVLSTPVITLVIINNYFGSESVIQRFHELVGIVAPPHTPPPRGIH